jgi:DNA polymerase-3 subunit delta'
MLFDDMEDDDQDDGNFDTPAAKGAEEFAAALSGGLLPPREMQECIGHEAVEKSLLDVINSGNIPHAIIFAGRQGIGKGTMAFRLARFMLNIKPADDSPGLFGAPPPPAKATTLSVPADDRVFRQVASGGHPDLLVVERVMDEKKGRMQTSVPVEEVRRVTPFLRMKAAHDGGWRVVIIDDADTMTNSSQNAILKILEEPPPRTLLILVCHRVGAMVPTIRSRCRVVQFQPLALPEYKSLIRREDGSLSDSDIGILHAITGGSVGQGLAMAAQGGLEAVSRVLALLDSWPKWDWQQVHALAEMAGRAGQEESLDAYQAVFVWIADAITRAKACDSTLQGMLNNATVLRLMNHYPLAAWIDIGEQLKTHFDTVGFANLDKRQAIIGAFSILDYKEAV